MSEKLMRFKRRYILIKPSTEAAPAQVVEAVRNCLIELYGRAGLAESGFKRISYRDEVILACYKEWVPRLVLAVSLSRNGGVVLRTVKISGTISSLVQSV